MAKKFGSGKPHRRSPKGIVRSKAVAKRCAQLEFRRRLNAGLRRFEKDQVFLAIAVFPRRISEKDRAARNEVIIRLLLGELSQFEYHKLARDLKVKIPVNSPYLEYLREREEQA